MSTVSVQTDSAKAVVKGVQTEINMGSGRDRSLQAGVEVTVGACQAVTAVAVGGCQATMECAVSESQTECVEVTSASQTVISMALQAERSMQAVADTAEGGNQTSISMALQDNRGVQVGAQCAEQPSQTAISMALQGDRGVQVGAQCAEQPSQTAISMALQAEQGVQAVIGTALGGSQTAISMALQADEGMQAVAECASSDSQTALSMALQAEQGMQAVIETGESDSQTTQSMALQAEQQVQAVTEMTASDSQTAMSMALQVEQGAQADQTTLNESQDSSGASQGEMLSQDLGGSQPSSTQPMSIPFGDLPPSVDGYERPSCDVEAQTDPVTIIIGDASFLVDQLKGSASSPAKIHASGNHVEIEVSVPMDGLPGPPADQPPVHTPHNKENEGRRSLCGRIDRRSENWALLPEPIKSSAHQGGKYSCPFCAVTFHESPALYDHLSTSHNEKCKSVKKVRGREGKTILYKEPMPVIAAPPPEGELEPPVLLPIIPWHQDTPLESANTAPAVEPEVDKPVDEPAEEANDVTCSQQFCCPLCPKTFAATQELEVHWAASHKADLAGGKMVRQMRPRAEQTETTTDVEEEAVTEATPDAADDSVQDAGCDQMPDDDGDKVPDTVPEAVSELEAPAKRKRMSASESIKKIKLEVDTLTSATRITRSTERTPVRETRTTSAKTPPQLERQSRSAVKKK